MDATSETGPAPASLLLRTKLYAPPPRPQHVPRPRLTRQLDDAIRPGSKLALVVAPAGFGKTTLLSAWMAQHPRPVAWFSLDEGDNDLTRFLRTLIAALQTVHPNLGQQPQSWLDAPQPPPAGTILTALANEIATLDEPLELVLSDYHVIDTPAVHDALNFLVAHQPPLLHLIITGRADPPLPLARLRARGQLHELRAADLRFTRVETAAFLNQVMGLALSPEDVAALEARSEGWAAGLQLAALALQREDDRHEFVQAFSGSHRYVLDYLTDEVLARQSPPVRDFLLRTAILDRFSGPLCDAVLAADPGSSQRLLAELEAGHLFLVPLDGQRRWYRYHHLFRDLLRYRLQQEQPGLAPTLHSRASAWYEAHDVRDEAISHALAGADWARAARLLAPAFFPMLMRGRQFTTLRWLEAFPEAERRQYPRLSLSYAWNFLFTGRVDAYEAPLRAAEQVWTAEENPAGLGQVHNLRANVARLRGDAVRTIDLARQAIALLPEDDRFQRSIATMALGAGHVLQGNVRAAKPVLVQARTLSAAADNPITELIAMNGLGGVQVMEGKLSEAADTYRAVLEKAGERPLWQRVTAAIALGDLHREWNELDQAATVVEQGMELARETQREVYLSHDYVVLARLRWAQGDEARAEAALAQAVEVARRFGDERARAAARAAQVRLQLATAEGIPAGVRQWQENEAPGVDEPPVYERQAAFMALARVLLAQGDPAPAGRVLERLAQQAEEAGRDGDLVSALVLLARVHRAAGRPDAALAALARALELARPGGYVRVFVDEGPEMARLLRRLATRGVQPEMVGRLLDALGEPVPSPPPAGSPLVEPLTPREREVLHLIADGATNREIADELVISIYTVKKHVSNLYGKLGVHSRTQALAEAQTLGLL